MWNPLEIIKVFLFSSKYFTCHNKSDCTFKSLPFESDTSIY